MKNIIAQVKGTREFYPEDMAIRIWLYNEIRKVSESYGYQEFDGPFLESIELYAAKSGDELVKEQSFVFPDRGGNLITLRPELTPSLARMVAQKQNELIFPLRWWSFGPFWRYEKPQKGRSREFFQWNIDLIGVNAAEADAELVSICASLFKNIGLTSKEVKIFINDRRLMDAQLGVLGISAERKPMAFKLIDRRDKLSEDSWEKYAFECSFTVSQLDGLKKILENKELFNKSDDLKRFFNAIQALGYEEYVVYDPCIIRGLDYYTGIVFEAKELGAGGRAILGGGRYDDLVSDVGGNPLPGVGFAMGDVVLPILLEKYRKLPKLNISPAPIVVTVFDEESWEDSIRLASSLRCEGLNVICYPIVAKLDKQIKFADRIGARFALIIGPDEIKNNQINIKNLSKGEQILVGSNQLSEKLLRMLADE